MQNALPVAERIANLEQRLADLKGRLPAHSASSRMMLEIEEIEEELERLKGELEEQGR